MPNKFAQKIYNKEIIRELYESGMSGTRISQHLGICHRQVYNIMNEIGLKRHKPGTFARIYSLDEDFFKVWSSHMAYWFGMLCADGNIHNSMVRLRLKESDSGHIVKFLKCIKSNSPPQFVYKPPTKKCPNTSIKSCGAYIHSRTMTNDLCNIGIISIKNGESIYIDSIEDEYFTHWLRGYSDGDGSVMLRTPTIRSRLKIQYPAWSLVCQHTTILKAISRRISVLSNVTQLNPHKSKTIFGIAANRQKGLKILNSIYCRSHIDIELDRKKTTYENICNVYTKR